MNLGLPKILQDSILKKLRDHMRAESVPFYIVTFDSNGELDFKSGKGHTVITDKQARYFVELMVEIEEQKELIENKKTVTDGL